MPIIKRYPNRKLYNTEAKQYITLDGIAQLIRKGEEVQVIDNVSGEDLTAVTLTQIIFEQEKRQGGFLPKSILTSLIRGGESSLDTVRRRFMSPLEWLRQVDGEIERRVHDLVSRGDLALEEGNRLREKLLSSGRRSTTISDESLQAMLDRRDVPTRHDLDQLKNQIADLARLIDDLDE